MEESGYSEDFVRSLLEEQHPDLAGLKLRLVDGGWGNQMWRLGDDLAVRMPRIGDDAPAMLRREHRWLPTLAPRLPLPVPTPIRLSEPSERFPHNWIVTTWVDGEPADREPIRDPDSAEALAGFLKALHQTAPADAPVNPFRGCKLAELGDGAAKYRKSGLASEFDAAAIEAVWEDAVAAPAWTGGPVWLHADLHPANVVTADGNLTGIVDFGDMCSGDPATDLAAAWILLPDGAAEPFFAAYGADEAAIRRARGWTVVKCMALLEIGHAGDMGWAGGKPTWGRAGRAALERLLA